MKHWRIIHTTLGYTAQPSTPRNINILIPLHWSSGERRDCVNVRSGNIWKPLSLPHPEASPSVCIIHNIKTVFQISGFNKRHNIDIRFYHHTNSSKGRSFLSGLNTFWIDTLILVKGNLSTISSKDRSYGWPRTLLLFDWCKSPRWDDAEINTCDAAAGPRAEAGQGRQHWFYSSIVTGNCIQNQYHRSPSSGAMARAESPLLF